MSYSKKELGIWGEKKAVEYLVNKDYLIKEKNFRTARGEIDIIACRDKTLVFIEVRTRSSNYFGYPAASINREKKKKIKKTASYYLTTNVSDYKNLRFDVISLLIKGENIYLRHIKNAF